MNNSNIWCLFIIHDVPERTYHVSKYTLRNMAVCLHMYRPTHQVNFLKAILCEKKFKFVWNALSKTENFQWIIQTKSFLQFILCSLSINLVSRIRVSRITRNRQFLRNGSAATEFQSKGGKRLISNPWKIDFESVETAITSRSNGTKGQLK